MLERITTTVTRNSTSRTNVARCDGRHDDLTGGDEFESARREKRCRAVDIRYSEAHARQPAASRLQDRKILHSIGSSHASWLARPARHDVA
jgi:hypothetical protein